MDNFTCKSCGATMYINTEDKPICAYCKSHLVKKINLSSSLLYKRYFFAIVLLFIIALTAYILVQKNIVSQAINPKTIQSDTILKLKKDVPDTILVEKMLSSYIEPSKHLQIETKMTQWMSRDEYSRIYTDSYFKQQKTYPIYLQTNLEGDIRVLIIKSEVSNWHYAAYMELEDFKRLNAKYTSKGYKILSLYILEQEYFKIYAASWVRKEKWNQEASVLLNMGIHPPSS